MPGVCCLAALNELFLFPLVHLLELKVACVRCRSKFASLQNHEHHSTYDGDEVKRQIHEVADDGAGSEFREWLCCKLAQLCNWVTARLDSALLCDQSGHIARHEGTVEGVDERIVNEEVLAQHVEDGGALAENQQDGRYERQRSIEDREDSRLGYVCNHEHEHGDAESQGHGRDQLRREGPP